MRNTSCQRSVISALNARIAELRAADVRLTDPAFAKMDALRDGPIGSEQWLDAAADLLNGAMKKTEGRLDLDAGGALGARFFMENFPENWRSAELGSKPKPITEAGIADRLNHRGTLGETARKQNEGIPNC